MKNMAKGLLAIAGVLFFTTTASAALPLRSPQVGFNFGPLQGYLNVVDSGINVATDQLDAQVWSVSITGNTDFTLMLESPIGAGNSVGVYNGPAAIPTLFQVFPGAAGPGWFATLHFAGGNLVVTLFDQNSVIQGQNFYAGVNQNAFGFYTQGPCGLWFSQDFRNPNPQILSYASNNLPGDYWVCFEACPYNPAASTFNGVVINIQSVRPTPATHTSWGQIKSIYH
jgi:hypothetical protein